ncbi:MAG: [LysW]-lysine hydrolase [Aggregatilineales bacterium]
MAEPRSIDAEALLIGLLEHVSLSHQERAAAEYLVGKMAALGYDSAFVDGAGNAVGIFENPTAGETREIVLLGHIDTVPGAIPVRVENGLVYGRGSVDAKGPLATFAAGAARVGAQPGWRIVVIGAVEEEAATSKGARYALTQYHPTLCVIGEPSSWDRITLGYKGRVLLDCQVQRPMAHTARIEANAAEQAVAFWNAIKADADVFNADHPRVFDQVTPSLRSIHSGDDGFLETTELTVGFRLPPELPPDALKARIASLANIAEHVELSWRGEEFAHRAEKNTPLARLFLNAIRDIGGKPSFVYKTGTSDMNVVAPIWNCPILAYGPGDSALDHTPEEHLPLEDYRRALAVIADVLRNLNTV